MRIRFTKMHGAGNDFVVIDAINQIIDLTQERVRAIATRRFGVGCDQLLLVEAPRGPDTDFHYRIYNADGGEVEQCGNGARCFARFVRDQGLTDKDEIPVGTAAGNICLYVEDDGQVRVNMGPPVLEPARIPIQAEQQALRYTLELEDRRLMFGSVSMGNPHAVFLVEDVDHADLGTLGPMVESHPMFPKRINVGFMQEMAPDHIRLRVHERGAGETLACGTGACAAVVCGRLQGQLDERVRVSLRGGDLMVEWKGEGEPVWMTGPAVKVFDGEIEL